MLSVLPLGAVLPSLALAGLAVAAIAVAVATAFYFLRARLYERLEDSLPASGAPDLHALGERIESLVGQQQLHGETQRQILSQKLDAIGQRFDEQRHAVDGLRHEMRHEAQRRDDELAEIRHQIAAIQQAAPALAAPAPLALGDGNATRLPPAEAPVAQPVEVVEAFESAAPPAPPVAEPATPAPPSAFESPMFAAPTFEVASFEAPSFEDVPLAAPSPLAFDAASFVTEAPVPPAGPTTEPPAPAAVPAVEVPEAPAPLAPVEATALDLPPGVVVERVSALPPVDPFALPFEAPAPAVAPAPTPLTMPAPATDPFGFAFEDPFAAVATAPPASATPPASSPAFSAPSAAAAQLPRVAPMSVSELLPRTPSPEPSAPAPGAPVSPTVAWATDPPPVASPAVPPVAETAWVARPDRDDAPAPIPMPDLPTAAPPVEAAPVEEADVAPEPAPEAFVTPEGADDLTVISSVDAAVQNALYIAGVHKLDEIARWGRSDARRVASQVGVSEDVIMTQWVFEAQAALFDQYTRQAS